MKQSIRNALSAPLSRGALTFGLVLGLTTVTSAQDEKPPIRPELDDIIPDMGGEQSAQDEMIELFQKVEKREMRCRVLVSDNPTQRLQFGNLISEFAPTQGQLISDEAELAAN